MQRLFSIFVSKQPVLRNPFFINHQRDNQENRRTEKQIRNPVLKRRFKKVRLERPDSILLQRRPSLFAFQFDLVGFWDMVVDCARAFIGATNRVLLS